jgi:DNA polymerase III alpha subunit
MAYAHLTYITAYLSLYYPQAWYRSLIEQKSLDGELTEVIPVIKGYIKDRGLDIEISAPHYSNISTKIKNIGNKIVLGLCDIKGVGEKAAEELLKLSGRELHPLTIFKEEGISKKALTTKVVADLLSSGFFGRFDESEFREIYRAIKTMNMTKVKAKEYENPFIDYEMFLFDEQLRMLGFSLKEYPYLKEAYEIVSKVYDAMPELAEKDFTFIYKIEGVTKRLTKKSRKRFYNVKAVDVDGNLIRFNLFTENIMNLENIFSIDIADIKNFEKKFALFYERVRFFNVDLIIPIK